MFLETSAGKVSRDWGREESAVQEMCTEHLWQSALRTMLSKTIQGVYGPGVYETLVFLLAQPRPGPLQATSTLSKLSYKMKPKIIP